MTDRLFQVTKHLGSTGTAMLDIMEEWVGTGCGDCCFVERSTLAKYGKIEADFSAIDPEVEEQEPCRSFEHLIMEDCSK